MTALFLALLPLATPALAHPGGHGHSEPKPAASASSETVIPGSYSGVVASLTEHLTAAEAALDTFKIADLHRHCDDLTALAKDAPSRAEDPAAVGPTATHLEAQIAEAVKWADKGDLEAAKAALASPRADLDTLKKLTK